jgi:hypothetical protein
MEYYSAEVIAVDGDTTTVRLESTGKQILFRHRDHNAVPADLRIVGAKGFVSFPKAPPVFTRDAQHTQTRAA